jgi:death on curing protein
VPRHRPEPIWVDRVAVDAIHLDMLRVHGGLAGIRDENALESALARPRNRWAYGRRKDAATLAACYGFGLARSHPYRDGNKRLAFLVMYVFLGLNGYDIEAAEPDVVTVMLKLAAGELSEVGLRRWLQSHMVPHVDS